MTSKPKFSNTVSMGNLLQIGAFIITIAGAWFTLDARSSTNQQSVSELRKDLTDARQTRDELARRVSHLEIEQARADERFSNILTLLSRIDGRLERIERTERNVQ